MRIFQTSPKGFILLALMALLYGCGIAEAERLPSLKDAMGQVDVVFEWSAEQKRWRFSNKSAIDGLISKYDREYAVRELVSCLNDTRQAKAHLSNGDSVPLAAICQAGLSITAYYEQVDEQGDIANFPPELNPSRDNSDWLKIQADWVKAIDLAIIKFY